MDLSEKLSVIRGLAPPVSGLGKKALLALNIGSGVQLPDGRRCVVDDVYNYEELDKQGNSKGFFWREYKLVCLANFDELYLEVEDDDGIAAYLTKESVAGGRITPDPEGLPREIGVRFSSGDVTMYLEEKGYARFTRQSTPDAPAATVTTLDYESEDERTLLGVELWGDSCEAFVYEEVAVKRLGVFAHKESDHD
jgi:hypothetical protein